jgi:hypothetical protein
MRHYRHYSVHLSEQELEFIGYEFAILCCTDGMLNITSKYSLIEIKNYFEQYLDPHDAIKKENIQNLENPTVPEPISNVLSAVPSAGNEEAATLNVAVDKTWISQWLAAIDADFSSYSACFESQGITNRVDLEQSDLLTPNDLLNTLMVSKLGHRMKITHWHKLLLQEKSLPASMVL